VGYVVTTDLAKFKARVEKLGVSAPGCHVCCFYEAPGHPGILVPIDGILEEMSRPEPIPDGPPQPVILIVDGLRHAVPAGTLVEIETGEIR
jgi:hypothetical protein